MPILMSHVELSSDPTVRWIRLQQVWGCVALLLFGVTYRLWLPQDEFPQVSLVRAFADWPAWINQITAGAVLVTLLMIVFPWKRTSRIRGWLWGGVVVGVVLMWLMNQHRLQPWAVHLVLSAVVFGSCHPKRGLLLLRMLAISIYVYSAAGKFDYQFMHSVGPQFLHALFALVGVDTARWDPAGMAKWSLMLPVAELMVGLLLCHRKTRPMGVVGAWIMHVSLIVVLSPAGLDHQWGVVVWNVLFLVQALALFWGNVPEDVESPTEIQSGWIGRLGQGVITAALVLPLLEPTGLYDHWPSWGLYSPRNSRVIVRVDLHAGEPFDALEEFFQPQFGDTAFRVLDLSRWSLENLGVPIYPQERFQLGVALAVGQKYALGRSMEVDLAGMSDRMTGSREREMLRGVDAIRMACDRFRLNAVPGEF